MANVRIVVVHPTLRADDSPLPISELKNWQLQARADAVPTFSNVGAPNAVTVLERTVQNVSPGRTWFRALWSDQQDRTSFADASVDVPVAAPKAGTITVTIVP